MAQYRKDRLASEIVKQTSRIVLAELRDPRLGFVTVTRAKVSDDYSYATIFVSVMGSKKQKKLTLSALKHAQGFIQRELARRIQMRTFPEVRFELDDSIDKAFKITALMDDLARERKKKEAPPPEAASEEE
ncbi:MAG TPA: 30S ribosome-binding factor RbfA [Planctomycetota bacterium]|nr:30S ribosome-binding factor RbfA [Planctomycetota bacterium]